jgi:predicted GIY-YIG superfamily endonuclease
VAQLRRRAKQPTPLRRSLAETAILLSLGGIPAHFNVVVQASRLLSACIMSRDKRLVYVMKNTDDSPRFYVGLTADVNARLEDHNAGRCPHTASHRPWQLHVVLEFSDQRTAIRFERYLKSGSGRAFAKRHFEP